MAIILPFVSRQWGSVDNAPVNSYVTLPISATPLAVVANDIDPNKSPLILTTSNYQNGRFMIDGLRVRTGNITEITNIWGKWIAICE